MANAGYYGTRNINTYTAYGLAISTTTHHDSPALSLSCDIIKVEQFRRTRRELWKSYIHNSVNWMRAYWIYPFRERRASVAILG